MEGRQKTNRILRQGLEGKYLSQALDIAKSEGFNCQRQQQLESDKRIKVATDGTLKQVKIYTCYYEEDANLNLCVKRTRLFIVAQYEKVIKANRHIASDCIWTQ